MTMKKTKAEIEQLREEFFAKALLSCYLIDEVTRLEQEFIEQTVREIDDTWAEIRSETDNDDE